MQPENEFDPKRIERPDKVLLWYYILITVLTGPLSPFVFVPLLCRYFTLRYKFDDSGVSMRWGVLFRREVYLTYRRIQDIHLTRNVLQRWMGLAKISLQTASGSKHAEMAIEGVLEADELRDYLYSQMRGARNDLTTPDGQSSAGHDGGDDNAIQVLEEIRDAMQRIVAQKGADGGDE